MRPFMFLLACLACSLLSGCETFRPNSRDYDDDTSKTHDGEWSNVRKEGRGTEPEEKEWDKATPYLMSPKAMEIEKNLGYGYGK